jgi:hyperosmotically inducible protein
MRNRFNGFGRILLAGALLAAGATLTPAQNAPKPDNTKANKQDRDANAPTADQQKNNKADRETAKQIRKAIMADKSLSTYAHNAKVIVQNGTVTLKGPVRSDEEKRAVEAKAAEVAGASNVKNELTIVSADSSEKPSKTKPTKSEP